MDVKLKYLDRTCLQEHAYLKLVRKYASKLEHDIVIVFDLRIKDFGSYIFDSKKKIHKISISPNRCGFTEEGIKLDDGAEKYHLIATTIHELHHAQQYEMLGGAFWNNKYSCAKDIENPDAKSFFSECEVEARTYENKNLLQAVDYYNRCNDE